MKIQTIICSQTNGDIYVSEKKVSFPRFADLDTRDFHRLGFRGNHPTKYDELIFEWLDKAYHISYLYPGGSLDVDFEVEDDLPGV